MDSKRLKDAVAAIASDLFGVTGLVALQEGDRDLNARVGAYVLKVHAAGVDSGELDFQDTALEHLAGTVAASLVPRQRQPLAEPWVNLDGSRRQVRMLDWLEGRVLADVPSQTTELLRSLGRVVATVDLALAGLEHPAQHRHSSWNLVNIPELARHVSYVEDPNRRTAVEEVIAHHRAVVEPALSRIPGQVIHGDPNDYNVIVRDDGSVRGLIDFGDLMTAPRVCDLAIAAAYAMFRQADPVRGILPMVAGYHEVAPLHPEELAILEPLIRGRLATTLVMSAHERARQPDNDYLLVSQDDAWRVLQLLRAGSADFAHYRFRDACGYEAHPRSGDVRQFLLSGLADPAPVLGTALEDLARITLDWSLGSPPESATSEGVRAAMKEAAAEVGIGRYGEDRGVYQSPAFVDPMAGEARSVHLGVDLFVAVGSAVHAPLDGVVAALGDNNAALDYGPVVILRHQTDGGIPFFTLYGHLSRESLEELVVGSKVLRGQAFVHVGEEAVNGGWPPHLHLQILMSLVDRGLDVPGVAAPSEQQLWKSLSPDPNLLLRCRTWIGPDDPTPRRPRLGTP